MTAVKKLTGIALACAGVDVCKGQGFVALDAKACKQIKGS